MSSLEVELDLRQAMLLDGLVNGLAVHRLFCSRACSNIDIRSTLCLRVPHGARLALRESSHAHFRLMPQFPNNAVVDWCWGGDDGASAGVVMGGGTDAEVAAGVAAAIDGGGIYTYSGVSVLGDRFDGPALSVGAEETSGSHGWCHVTSREYTAISVSTSRTFEQLLTWLYPKFVEKHGRAWRMGSRRRGIR